MKKIILLIIVQLTVIMAGSFVMIEGNPSLTKVNTTVSDTTGNTSLNTTITYSNFTPKPLPTDKFNVLDYGLKGDGITDDSAALKTLAKNTNVTNWYFPEGHTFKLYAISVPSHVNTVWGGGTLKTIYKSVNMPQGCFHQMTTPTTHLLFDNIKFIYDNTSFSNGNYGAITLAKAKRIENVEIRNCTFTGNSFNPMNGITLIGNREVGGLKHINIHDNKFLKISRAGIEILKRNDSNYDYDDGVEDVNIFNNHFDPTGGKSGWRCAVSFSQVRKQSSVNYNTFNNNAWDIELAQGKDITVRNNKSTKTQKYFMSVQDTIHYESGVNWIYDNHFDSQKASLHLIMGSSSEVYNNFIRGQLWQQRGIAGNIHHNTIVKDMSISAAWGDEPVYLGDKEESPKSTVHFYENDIYMIGSGGNAISISSDADSDCMVENNNIYRVSSDTGYISTGTSATVKGNTGISNYNEENIPNSRP